MKSNKFTVAVILAAITILFTLTPNRADAQLLGGATNSVTAWSAEQTPQGAYSVRTDTGGYYTTSPIWLWDWTTIYYFSFEIEANSITISRTSAHGEPMLNFRTQTLDFTGSLTGLSFSVRNDQGNGIAIISDVRLNDTPLHIEIMANPANRSDSYEYTGQIPPGSRLEFTYTMVLDPDNLLNGMTHSVMGITPIPEPSAVSMVLVGVAVMSLLSRRRHE